jgi:GAF domain-containing protein
MRSVSHEELHSILGRLAHVGALATNADSCFIFLLANFPEVEHVIDLELVAFHSALSVNDQAFIERYDQSPIGWIALHAMPLNISTVQDPHEFSEVYEQEVEIKSFFGIPLIIPGEYSAVGVIACDSRKERAFSRVNVGLIEHLAAHISDLLLNQRLGALRATSSSNSWDDFIQKVEELVGALGKDGVDIIRLSSLNFVEIERLHGLQRAVDLVEQLEALIQQSVPPQFPLFRLPNGDVIVALDKMMLHFVKTKIAEVLKSLQTQGHTISFGSIGKVEGVSAKTNSVEELLKKSSLTEATQAY